jgi:hypothetical protein
MTIIFKAVSRHCGHSLKSVSSHASITIKNGYLHISDKGIRSTNMDPHKRILLDFFLDSECFDIFELHVNYPIYKGINFVLLEKILKSMKKTDQLELRLDDAHPNILFIKITPSGIGGRISEVDMPIENKQNTEIDIPDGYKHHILINSSDWNQMSKEIKNMIIDIPSIEIDGYKYNNNDKFTQLVFASQSAFNRSTSFCNYEIKNEHKSEHIYNDKFNTNMLLGLVKLNGMCKQLHVYFQKDAPLKITMDIGYLGTLNIYFKSEQQIKYDQEEYNSDEE